MSMLNSQVGAMCYAHPLDQDDYDESLIESHKEDGHVINLIWSLRRHQENDPW